MKKYSVSFSVILHDGYYIDIKQQYCLIRGREDIHQGITKYYLLTDWLAYLYGRVQSPRPDVMPDRREGITRAEGFGFACIDTQAS